MTDTSPTEAPLASPPSVVRRVVYLGTPAIAVPPLRALHDAGFDVALVVTAPDKRRGRGSSTTPTPVKAAALELGIPISHTLDDVLGVDADLAVVVAYGQLIPGAILEQLAMVNIHFSLLPRWRGAAPVERAILAGDDETGVCLMALERGLDTGGIYRVATLPIGQTSTLPELWHDLSDLGADLLVTALQEGLGEPRPQRGEPTYAKKLLADEFRLSFDQSAIELHRRIRVGRAWAEFRGKRLKLLAADLDQSSSDLAPGQIDIDRIGTSDGALRPTIVQPEGKAAMAFDAWRNGAQPGTNDRLT